MKATTRNKTEPMANIPKELHGLINLLAEFLADEFLKEHNINYRGNYDEQRNISNERSQFSRISD